MKFLNLLIVLFLFYNFGGSSSSSCGELGNITYPYYLPGVCKWKVYQLQCDGNDTVVYIGATKYLVKDMSIVNKTLRLVDPDLAVGGCSLPNQTFNQKQYDNLLSWYSTTSSYYASLIYFLNCTREVEDSMYKLIHCMDRPRSRVYARLDSDTQVGSTPKSCRYVARTAANSEVQKLWNDSDGVDMMQMLRRGLVVSWDLSAYDSPTSYYPSGGYYNERCSLLHYCWSSTTSDFMYTMRYDHFTVDKLNELLLFQSFFLECIYPSGSVGAYSNPGVVFGFMLALLALLDILLVLIGRMTYPRLLYVPQNEHRIALLNNPAMKDFVLGNNSHRMHIEYQKEMGPALKNLGLYQLARMGDCRIDKSLITALVERWRPETNTFHLPFGEMTVTLEDVSILWGLSDTGTPITGISDDDWNGLVANLLGLDPSKDPENPERSPWRFYKRNNRCYFSNYHLRLSYLKSAFERPIEQEADEETINQYTRAFCMELFGSLMFGDKSGDSVPAMYLQFLGNLDDPPEYDWGSAVLAYLYRQLSEACLAKTNTIGGPLLLLQMWSWTRFPIGRPNAIIAHPPLGGADQTERLPFGVKWTTPHEWRDNTHYGGTSHFRDDYEALLEPYVNWFPYDVEFNDQLLPPRVYRDKNYFKSRGCMIHFWIVTMHYPDRVMHQFGLLQRVPPPDPLPWEQHRCWNEIEHDTGRAASKKRDWGIFLNGCIQEAWIPCEVEDPWYIGPREEYIKWMNRRGMTTVFMYTVISGYEVPLPVPSQAEVANLSYQPRGSRLARVLYINIRLIAQGILWVKTPGQMAFGKHSLIIAEASMDALGHLNLFQALLRYSKLSINPRFINCTYDIPNSEPASYENTPEPSNWDSFEHDPTDFSTRLVRDMMTRDDDPSNEAGPSTQARPSVDTRPPVGARTSVDTRLSVGARPSVDTRPLEGARTSVDDTRPRRPHKPPSKWTPPVIRRFLKK